MLAVVVPNDTKSYIIVNSLIHPRDWLMSNILDTDGAYVVICCACFVAGETNFNLLHLLRNPASCLKINIKNNTIE